MALAVKLGGWCSLALLKGIHVVTVHNKAPTGDLEPEQFDAFVDGCPADIRDGRIRSETGEEVKCPKLFDEIAVDLLGGGRSGAAKAYNQVAAALLMQALKPMGTTAIGRASSTALPVGELDGALSEIVPSGIDSAANGNEQTVMIEMGDL